MLLFKALTLILSLASIQNVVGHGRLRSPPSRATCWREGFPNPPDYNDNQGFCGGAQYQQNLGGKCGICGDPWDGPKPHEAPGGTYANGIIVNTYQSGQEVEVNIEITANHKGYFEFKLCPNDNIHQDPKQDCFDDNVLEVVNGNGKKFPIGTGNKNYFPIIKLPEGMTCSQCILQWTYITGNSWACDPATGKCCVGCNPLKQEHFRACADIAISNNGGPIGTNPPGTTTTSAPVPPVTTTTSAPTPPPASTTTTSSGGCKAIGPWSGQAAMNTWCERNCNHNPPFCPGHMCVC